MADRPIIPEWPAPPTRGEPQEVFTQKYNARFAAEPVISAKTNELGAWMEATAAAIENIFTQADELNAAVDAALAASNGKGAWARLSGSLNVPASVSHNGGIWLLNVNLPNVANSEPKEGNPDWTNIGSQPVSDAEITAGTSTSIRSWAANDVRKAVHQHSFGNSSQTFTSSGVWPKPDGVTHIYYVLVGGGGGGGPNSASDASGGAGGHGGSVRFGFIDVTGDVVVTIGAGGIGGSAFDGTTGATGSNSSFSGGCEVTALGGGGGVVSSTRSGGHGARKHTPIGKDGGLGDLGYGGGGGGSTGAGADGGGDGVTSGYKGNGYDGTANTGGGGGGASSLAPDQHYSGGNGGSGIAIIYW